MEIENRLKYMRLVNGDITQEELAKKLGISRQTVTAIERGKFNPSVKLALAMAELFSCKVEDIFNIKRKDK
jgi:putative transcriptional regulator